MSDHLFELSKEVFFESDRFSATRREVRSRPRLLAVLYAHWLVDKQGKRVGVPVLSRADEPVVRFAMTTMDLALLERISRKRRFGLRTLEIATRMLVHGDEPKRLSLEYGINVQRVYAIRKAVSAAVEGARLPRGWERLELAAPRKVIERIKRQLDEEMAKLGASS